MSRLIREQLDDILSVENSLNKNISNVRCLLTSRNKDVHDFVTQQGSTVDGASLARLCFPGAPKHEVEIDLLYNGGCFPADMESNFHQVEGKPAHLKIVYDPVYLKFFRPKIKEIVDQMNSGYNSSGFLNSQLVKQITRDKVEYKDDDNILKNVLSILFGVSFKEVTVEANDEVKQATATTTLDIKFLKDNSQMTVSIDHVPGFQVMFWPKQAQNWITRDTLWPNKDTKKEISAEGCFVVPKPSTEGDSQLEWRYSFTNAEAKLMGLLSYNQKRAYFLFKAIFYMHIKPIEGPSASGNIKKIFFSYLVKTTMLSVCEIKPLTDPLWKDENIISCTTFLVEYMEKQFKEGNIPHYFIPEVNLLDDICRFAHAAWIKAIGELACIKENLIEYVPPNLVDLSKSGEELDTHMLMFKSAADVMASGDVEKLFNQLKPFLKK